MKKLLLLIIITLTFQTLFAQKKYINRKVAQKNYDGYMLMNEQKYDSALILFNEALEADSEAFFIYQNRAFCNLKLKDTLSAINDFKSNIRLDPSNAESLYSLGNIYKKQKDSIRSIKYFFQSIEKADIEFSQNKLLFMNNFIGNYYRVNEKYDSALVYYNQIKYYTPQNSSAFINSALCYFGLDSIDNFCKNLEQAYILGGVVNCYILSSYCNGCSHLYEESGRKDTLSKALDIRLRGIIQDTISDCRGIKKSFELWQEEPTTKKIKIYFNKYWQICLPENAKYYREAFWAKHYNFFGGKFTDYYIDGKVYAEGSIDRTKLNGSYKCYYPNGNLKVKGQFIKGEISGIWKYFLENDSVDFEIDIFFESFKIKILNKSNPNYQINSGTGKFKILLDRWDNIKFVVSGEYLNNKRNGQWSYSQKGEKIIWELYKKGEFKRGHFSNGFTNINTLSGRIDASTFSPPQLKQVRNLYFASIEATKFYPFIKLR